jgi:hypothetical protein
MKLIPFEKEEVEGKKVSVIFSQLPKELQKRIMEAAVEYEKCNQESKLFAARRDKVLRPIVENAVDNWGAEDNEGHLHLITEEAEIIRQKKVSRSMNTVLAEQLLREKGLYESCVQVVMSYEIDEEKIIHAYEAGKISASELDTLFTERINYATIVKTDDKLVQEIVFLRKEIEREKGEMIEIEQRT